MVARPASRPAGPGIPSAFREHRRDARSAGPTLLAIGCAGVLAAGSLLGGCGSRDEPPRERLRVGIEASPTSLDPRYAADADGSRITGLVHCALVRPDERGGFARDLAASWSQRDDATWMFELRPSARFHDGSPVTSADVVATLRSVLDPAMGSPRRGALAPVSSIEAEGPSRVVFHLARPGVAFLEGATVGVLPAPLAAQPRHRSGVLPGCGPYRVESADDHAVVLRAYDGYADGAPTLPAIEFRVVPDTVMRTLQLRSGDLDLVQNALEPDATRSLASDSSLRVSVTPYDAYQYLGINHRHPALRDLRVRRAIAYAIDREAIVTYVLAGQAEVATGLVPPHQAAYSGDVRRYRFDPARARALLGAAGFPDPDGPGPLPRLRLRYATSTVELRRRIAEVVAANLADVGIAVTIESSEWGAFFDRVGRGDFDLYSLAWIGIRDPDLQRVTFHSAMVPPAGSNRGYFSSRRMDRLTERARDTADPAARLLLYARVQRTAARALPYVPLWWPRNVVVTSRRVERFVPDPAGDLRGLVRTAILPP